MLKRAVEIELGADGGPAAFRRLCVETFFGWVWIGFMVASRLQAAVC